MNTLLAKNHHAQTTASGAGTFISSIKTTTIKG